MSLSTADNYSRIASLSICPQAKPMSGEKGSRGGKEGVLGATRLTQEAKHKQAGLVPFTGADSLLLLLFLLYCLHCWQQWSQPHTSCAIRQLPTLRNPHVTEKPRHASAALTTSGNRSTRQPLLFEGARGEKGTTPQMHFAAF